MFTSTIYITELYVKHIRCPARERTRPHPTFPAYFPTTDLTTTATFADDALMLSVHPNPEITSHYLQSSCSQDRCHQLGLRINEKKSIHITFSVKRLMCPPVKLDDPFSFGQTTDLVITHMSHTQTTRDKTEKYAVASWKMASETLCYFIKSSLSPYRPV